jgi:hypothetical protein
MMTSRKIRRMVKVSLIEDLELIEERNNIRFKVGGPVEESEGWWRSHSLRTWS